jgi:hypothetical protein
MQQWHHAEFLNMKPDGTFSNPYAFKVNKQLVTVMKALARRAIQPIQS